MNILKTEKIPFWQSVANTLLITCIVLFITIFMLFFSGTIYNKSTMYYFFIFMISSTLITIHMKIMLIAKERGGEALKKYEKAKPMSYVTLIIFCGGLLYSGWVIFSSIFTVLYDLQITTTHPEAVVPEVGTFYTRMFINVEQKPDGKAVVHIPTGYRQRPDIVVKFFKALAKQEIEPENDIRVIISQDNDPELLDALEVEAGSEIPLMLSYSQTAILDQNAILEQLSAESGDNFCYLAIPIAHPEIKLMFDPFKEEDARMLTQIYDGNRDGWMNKTADHFCLNYTIEINKVIKGTAPSLLIYDGHLMIGSRLAHIPCYISKSYPEVFYHNLSLDKMYDANMEFVSRLILPNAARYIQNSSSSWRIVRRSWYQYQECLRARKNPGYRYLDHVDPGRDLF